MPNLPPLTADNLNHLKHKGLSSLTKAWQGLCHYAAHHTSCVFCQAGGAAYNCCDACYAGLPIIVRGCYSCAVPLAYTLNGNQTDLQLSGINYQQTEQGYLCQSCYATRPARGAVLDWVWAPYAYYAPLSAALHLLKFKQVFYYGNILGRIWARRYVAASRENRPLPPGAASPDLILPMPLNKYRQRKRGFNQSQELALPLARLLDVPLVKGGQPLCLRPKRTVPQLQLNSKERKQNLHRAFVVNEKSPHYEGLADKSILLIDDVITTGTTLHELARTLKKAGARQVIAWSLLRA